MRKKQIVNRVVFLISIVISLVVGTNLAIGILFIITVSILLQRICLFAAADKITVRIKCSTFGERKEKTCYRILLENKSIMPVFQGQLTYTIENIFIGTKEKKIVRFYLNPKEAKQAIIEWIPTYCGGIRYTINQVEIQDSFCIWSKKIYVSQNEQIVILPKIHLIGENIENQNSLLEEWQDIRTYQYGDDIRSIHWKMSAKHQEVMVRNRRAYQKSPILLIYENGIMNKNEKRKPADCNQAIEFFNSISNYLIAKENCLKVAWTSEEGKLYISEEIETKENLLTEIRVLLQTKSPIVDQSTASLYKNNKQKDIVRQVYITPYSCENHIDLLIYDRNKIKQILEEQEEQELWEQEIHRKES